MKFLDIQLKIKYFDQIKFLVKNNTFSNIIDKSNHDHQFLNYHHEEKFQ